VVLTRTTGQASLPDTCPVCAHTPISSDLCKPNKALRTTLKAFLRTEEKKREKERQERQERQEAQPAPSDTAAPAEEASVRHESQQDSNVVEETPADGPLPNAGEDSSAAHPVDTAPSAAEVDAPGEEQIGTNGVSQVVSFLLRSNSIAQI
jgi:cell wall-associated NlpC family hydrolase